MKKNKFLRNTLIVTLSYIVFSTIMSVDGYQIFVGAMLIIILACVIGVFLNLRQRKNDDSKMPHLTKEKETHYEQAGMSPTDIEFFRQTMADTKEQIVVLEKNTQQVAKLKAIDLRFDTLKAARAMFKEIVKEPQKLHQADQFLYHHLPNLVELTDKYVEINNHELKNKTTYDVLNQSAQAIEDASKLIVKDYQEFVSDDIDAMEVEIEVAKQNSQRDENLHPTTNDKE